MKRRIDAMNRLLLCVFLLPWILILAAPSPAWSQFAWTRDEFTAAIEAHGGKFIGAGDPNSNRPLKDQTFKYELNEVRGGVNRHVCDVQIALRDEKIARVKFIFASSMEPLLQIFQRIEKLRALGPRPNELLNYREDPFTRKIFPIVGSAGVSTREIQGYTGYDLVNLRTGARSGIWAGTGHHVPILGAGTFSVSVFARDDHQEYIAVHTSTHVSQEQNRPPSVTNYIHSVAYCDREAFWDFTFWEMQEVATKYEEMIKQVTPANKYEQLQHGRRLEAILYQIDHSPSSIESLARQLDLLAAKSPDTKKELLAKLKNVNKVKPEAIMNRFGPFESLYGIESIDFIIPKLDDGEKFKTVGVAALDRLAARLALPPTPGMKGTIKDWRDWATAAKKGAK